MTFSCEKMQYYFNCCRHSLPTKKKKKIFVFFLLDPTFILCSCYSVSRIFLAFRYSLAKEPEIMAVQQSLSRFRWLLVVPQNFPACTSWALETSLHNALETHPEKTNLPLSHWLGCLACRNQNLKHVLVIIVCQLCLKFLIWVITNRFQTSASEDLTQF